MAGDYPSQGGTHNGTFAADSGSSTDDGMTPNEICPSGIPVTFQGRGLGLRVGSRLLVLVCPLCSQRNAPRGAERGICEWCAYVPSEKDEHPARK